MKIPPIEKNVEFHFFLSQSRRRRNQEYLNYPSSVGQSVSHTAIFLNYVGIGMTRATAYTGLFWPPDSILD